MPFDLPGKLGISLMGRAGKGGREAAKSQIQLTGRDLERVAHSHPALAVTEGRQMP